MSNIVHTLTHPTDGPVVVHFTIATARALEETGANVQEDFDNLIAGITDEEGLLEHCLDGLDLDENDAAAWRDYVSTLASFV